jgi:hypothetical protein
MLRRIGRLAPALLLASTLVACGGGTDPDAYETATFVFRIRNLPPSEEFRIRSASPTFIAQARAQLALPEAQRRKFVSGPIAAGNGGANVGWSWHFTDAALVEATMELCDGRPRVRSSSPCTTTHTSARRTWNSWSSTGAGD